MPTVYISEIYCCIAKSTNLPTIFQFCTKYMKTFKIGTHCVHVASLFSLSNTAGIHIVMNIHDSSQTFIVIQN
jgi:hypothetical protein